MRMHLPTKPFTYEKVIQNTILHQLGFSHINNPISNKSHKHHKSPLESSSFSLVFLRPLLSLIDI